MNEKKIIELISMYFDGELKKGEEALLFSELSGNSEGRRYFKTLGRIRSAADESAEEFPEELDERIIKSIGRLQPKKAGFFKGHNIPMVISYAAILVMLMISGYILMQVSYYKDKVNVLSGQLEQQTKTIQMLYNSLPGIEVRAAAENEIIIKPSL
jgi:hypothetical protein